MQDASWPGGSYTGGGTVNPLTRTDMFVKSVRVELRSVADHNVQRDTTDRDALIGLPPVNRRRQAPVDGRKFGCVPPASQPKPHRTGHAERSPPPSSHPTSTSLSGARRTPRYRKERQSDGRNARGEANCRSRGRRLLARRSFSPSAYFCPPQHLAGVQGSRLRVVAL